jgi:hypothetical protein
MKTFFQKSTEAVVETVKQIMNGPSVPEAEAQWVLAQEDVDRHLALFDEDPTPTNRAALQAARANLKDMDEEVASARRREAKRQEKFMTAKTRAALAQKAELIRAIRESVAHYDAVLIQHLEPAGIRVMETLSAANALGDTAICGTVASVIHAIPFVTNDKLRIFPTVKHSGVSPEAVSTLARWLRGLPVLDEKDGKNE